METKYTYFVLLTQSNKHCVYTKMRYSRIRVWALKQLLKREMWQVRTASYSISPATSSFQSKDLAYW